MTAGELVQTLEQTNYNLYIRWQAVRRDPKYRAFCDQYKQYFDDNGVMRRELLPTEDAEKEADHFKETYGLDFTYHYNIELDLDYFIDSCVFKEPFVVNYILKDKKLDFKTLPETIDNMSKYSSRLTIDPFWEPNYIHLWVNVGEGITEAQLKEEFLEKVREARDYAGIKRIQSIPSEKDFKIYDLLTYEKKGFKEIFEEVWPEDFEKAFSGLSDTEIDRLYKKLIEEYRNQEIKNWAEKAWVEAYGGGNYQNQGLEDLDAATGKKSVSPKQLYDRVAKGIKRVDQHIKRVKLHN